MAEDEFEEITKAVPELAALDDGFTITIGAPGSSVMVTRVEFDGWVRELTDFAIENPATWLQGAAGFSDRHWTVVYAVVRESYRCLAEVVFASADPMVMPGLLKTMQGMALFCRGEHALAEVNDD